MKKKTEPTTDAQYAELRGLMLDVEQILLGRRYDGTKRSEHARDTVSSWLAHHPLPKDDLKRIARFRRAIEVFNEAMTK